jgi:hypothetical protein
MDARLPSAGNEQADISNLLVSYPMAAVDVYAALARRNKRPNSIVVEAAHPVHEMIRSIGVEKVSLAVGGVYVRSIELYAYIGVIEMTSSYYAMIRNLKSNHLTGTNRIAYSLKMEMFEVRGGV